MVQNCLFDCKSLQLPEHMEGLFYWVKISTLESEMLIEELRINAGSRCDVIRFYLRLNNGHIQTYHAHSQVYSSFVLVLCVRGAFWITGCFDNLVLGVRGALWITGSFDNQILLFGTRTS